MARRHSEDEREKFQPCGDVRSTAWATQDIPISGKSTHNRILINSAIWLDPAGS